jgi:hypothetical protein
MRAATLTALILFLHCSATGATDLVTNGQFSSGLTGWNFSVSTTGSMIGTCSYNTDTAPATETLTGTPGFPATGGATMIALGSGRLVSRHTRRALRRASAHRSLVTPTFEERDLGC